MFLFHLLDSSKIAPCSAASFFRGHAGSDVVALGEFQVGEDFAVDLAFQASLSNQRQASCQKGSEVHAEASRNRATSAFAFRQFSISILSCFAPALVSE